MDTCAAESPRVFYFEDVPPSTVKLPGATLDGLAAESWFFSSGSREENKGAPDEEDRQAQTPGGIYKYRGFFWGLVSTPCRLSAAF